MVWLLVIIVTIIKIKSGTATFIETTTKFQESRTTIIATATMLKQTINSNNSNCKQTMANRVIVFMKSIVDVFRC